MVFSTVHNGKGCPRDRFISHSGFICMDVFLLFSFSAIFFFFQPNTKTNNNLYLMKRKIFDLVFDNDPILSFLPCRQGLVNSKGKSKSLHVFITDAWQCNSSWKDIVRLIKASLKPQPKILSLPAVCARSPGKIKHNGVHKDRHPHRHMPEKNHIKCCCCHSFRQLVLFLPPNNTITDCGKRSRVIQQKRLDVGRIVLGLIGRDWIYVQ